MRTLIILMGSAGSGKTTASDIIIKEVRKKGLNITNIKFAKPLYKIHNFFFKNKKRWFLLLLGNIVSFFKLRKYICKSWYNTVRNAFNTDKMDVVVCDDLRFPLECDTIYNMGMNNIYQQLIVMYINTDISKCLNRSGNTKKQMGHDSELYVSNNWDKLHNEYGPALMITKHIVYYDITLPNNDGIDIYTKAITNYIGGKL